MQLIERMNSFAAGRIRAVWTDRATGREMAVACDKPNVILYSAADILARLVSGDAEVAPGFVGYVYAPNTASVPNPASDPAPRHFDWSDILGNIIPVSGNMVISPITTTPRIVPSSGDYAGNMATFSAMSDSTAAPVVVTDPPSLGPQVTDKYFQVVLLSRVFELGTPVYIPFAYTQLAAGNDGVAVLANMELTVYWTISFK